MTKQPDQTAADPRKEIEGIDYEIQDLDFDGEHFLVRLSREELDILHGKKTINKESRGHAMESIRKAKQLPNLSQYALEKPPVGYRINYKISQKRDQRKYLLVTKDTEDSLDNLASRYGYSVNNLMNAVLIKFIEDVRRIDEYNEQYGFPVANRLNKEADI